jgi:hypothetical protein
MILAQANVPILDEAYQVTLPRHTRPIACGREKRGGAERATVRYVRGMIGKSRTVAPLRHGGVENGRRQTE